MSRFVMDLDEIDRTQVATVGGKAAHLGELSRIEGVRVPPGFCVTTDAFEQIVAAAPSLDDRIERLSRAAADDRETIGALSAEIRAAIAAVMIPHELARAITSALARLGEDLPCAVRSSATAEDLPTASFAGQQDSYLDVVGAHAVLEHVSRCWGSLFTERAVTYRMRNGIDHRQVRMAVVVQRMVQPKASGVLFTADPVSGNRRIASVEAVAGLGEALVSGLVNAHVFSVRDGQIVRRAGEPGEQPVLTDAQVVRLVELGRRIEQHFGSPQDIEWCLAGDDFDFVQSRPITTLFPIPVADDDENHVYLSVGHQQMMTDAMKPLGISVWQLTTMRPMAEAGSRLFVDVTHQLASPTARATLLDVAGRSDPLITDALQTILDRGGFVPSSPDDAEPARPVFGSEPVTIETDPATVTGLIQDAEASVGVTQREISLHSGAALLDFILSDMEELKRFLFDPRSLQVILAGMRAAWWLNEQLHAWLGEKNVADALTQSVPHNVTSEMGLALLDVADAIRPHPDVVAFLERVADDAFLDALPALRGGAEARAAIRDWLDRYGMRCPGEIDITRPRWSEQPSTLVPLILGHIHAFEPGEAVRRFERGVAAAHAKEQNLLERLRTLPDGAQKAAEAKRMIDRVRTFAGYREYPKYAMVSRYFVYKQALLREAERLVHAGVLRNREDVFYLTFAELREVVRTSCVDEQLIDERRNAFRWHLSLTAPRVLTSEGEGLNGAYRRGDVPEGALVGLPVSAGIIEGRARVVLDMAHAHLEPGDILVTAFTDPSWTPLFLSVRGLVTEVGGLMTHGAVIAREYGLPAVVGVQHATRLIRDGERIRVNGADGYVERLAGTGDA